MCTDTWIYVCRYYLIDSLSKIGIYMCLYIYMYVWITQRFMVQGFISIREGNVVYSEAGSIIYGSIIYVQCICIYNI